MDGKETQKRGRGRPRKNPDEIVKKRPRGRPRKKVQEDAVSETGSSSVEDKKKGTRGRNRKPIVITAPALNPEELHISSDEEDLVMHIPISDLDEDEIGSERIDELFRQAAELPADVPMPEFDENRVAKSKNVKDLVNPEINIEPMAIETPLDYELFFPSDDDEKEENAPKISNNKYFYQQQQQQQQESNLITSTFTGRYGKAEDNMFTKVSVYRLEQPLVNNGKFNCWWCCHPFRGVVIPLPYRYIEFGETRRNKYEIGPDGKSKWVGREHIPAKPSFFKVKGCFCSYNCAKAYNIRMTRDGDKLHRNALLHWFYRKMSGDNVAKHIPEAPPRETLIAFGGHLHITQFRLNANTSFEIIERPGISRAEIAIEETKHERHAKMPVELSTKKKVLRKSQPRKANALRAHNSSGGKQ